MNDTAKKLREAADYMKSEGVASVVGDIRNTFAAIADELDKLQMKANEANNLRQQLESAEDKAERRKRHIGYLNTALHDKNGLLARRGGTIARLTAENGKLRKQVPSERERQILDMWPRFEDGEYVWFGDEVACRGKVCMLDDVKFVSDGTFHDETFLYVSNDLDVFEVPIAAGELVKRPARSVLDADGVETKKGDTVYLLKDGDKCRVTGFETIDGEVFARLRCDDRPEIEGARGSAITHRRRVLDADGVEIKVGDTVWHEDGSEWFVEEMTRLGVRCFDGERRRTFVTAFLTHTRPDSWERLEEDAEKLACAYLGRSEGTCFGCPLENCKDFAACSKEQAKDIVRRAKALAGVEVE